MKRNWAKGADRNQLSIASRLGEHERFAKKSELERAADRIIARGKLVVAPKPPKKAAR